MLTMTQKGVIVMRPKHPDIILSITEWNKRIIPAVDQGKIKDRSSELPKGFLMVFQTMECLIEDANGMLYRCIGWNPPNKGIPYVSLQKYELPPN